LTRRRHGLGGHGLRQIDVRDPAVLLQLSQDVDIDAIELHGHRDEILGCAVQTSNSS
jgi:hypothetical protein